MKTVKLISLFTLGIFIGIVIAKVKTGATQASYINNEINSTIEDILDDSIQQETVNKISISDMESIKINEETVKEDENKIEYTILFVGDSRFVDMEEVNTRDYTFFAEDGKGYEWYIENQLEIESLIDDNTIIIFGLGVNDLYNIDNYKTLSNSTYFNRIYFVSVNPVEESLAKSNKFNVTNEDINNFNNEMQQLFNERYIDTNSYLVQDTFVTTDGMHYTTDVYQDIYIHILSYLKSQGILEE